MKLDEELSPVVERLKQSRRVLVITGAGLSAESGLPTYRGIGGLYHAQTTEEGVPIEDALSGWMLQTRPELTWRYIHQIEKACRGAAFNESHEVIAKMQDVFDTVVVLTQNVDGFHQDAGNRDVIDIHGNIHRLFCTSSACTYEAHVDDYSDLGALPRCPQCDSVIRPDVVLFGEMLPIHRVERLHGELARGFDFVFSIGTSSLFPYIAGPVLSAAREGVPTCEINPHKSAVSHVVSYRIRRRVGEVLPRIWTRLGDEDRP